MTELKNYSEENRKLLLDWLNSSLFDGATTHERIETEKFRSDQILTWRAASHDRGAS
jgi:hypothetical protein